MRLLMKSRKELNREVSAKYRKVREKGKSQIQSEFVASTGYNRSYATVLLRNYGKRVKYQYGHRNRSCCSHGMVSKSGSILKWDEPIYIKKLPKSRSLLHDLQSPPGRAEELLF